MLFIQHFNTVPFQGLTISSTYNEGGINSPLGVSKELPIMAVAKQEGGDVYTRVWRETLPHRKSKPLRAN